MAGQGATVGKFVGGVFAGMLLGSLLFEVRDILLKVDEAKIGAGGGSLLGDLGDAFGNINQGARDAIAKAGSAWGTLGDNEVDPDSRIVDIGEVIVDGS